MANPNLSSDPQGQIQDAAETASTVSSEHSGHISDQALDQVTGGVSEIVITKPTDSTSPK